jgi:hypothetical protein
VAQEHAAETLHGEREADLVLVRGLRHPNLVRILDRSRDEQGVPWQWSGSTAAPSLR